VPSQSKEKHRIKQVDRLLGNTKLHAEFPLFFKAIASILLKGQRRPPILIDWTEVGGGRFYALAATVPIPGRSIPIYIEVHPQKKNGNRAVEHAFLDTLKESIVPETCRPIIITDAGFKNPWFRKVLGLGWDYIGRVNAHVLTISASASPEDIEDRDAWTKARKLYKQANKRAKNLGEMIVAKSNSLRSRLVLVAGPKQSRKSRTKPKRRRSKTIEYHRQRTQEPWLLQSSLTAVCADDIVRWYSTRMRIEESFRDMKSHRFGMSLEDARTHAGKYNRQTERFTVLLLLATLGLLLFSLAGQLAVRRKLAASFQANTTPGRRTLSLVFLGRRILKKRDLQHISPEVFLYAWLDLRKLIAELSDKAVVAG